MVAIIGRAKNMITVTNTLNIQVARSVSKSFIGPFCMDWASNGTISRISLANPSFSTSTSASPSGYS
jgi:hypothetical protein